MVRTLVLHCDVTFQNSAGATCVVTMITLIQWYTLRFHMSVPFEGVNFFCQIIDLFFHNFNGSFKEHNFVNQFRSVICVTSCVMFIWAMFTKFTALLYQEELAQFGVSFGTWFVKTALGGTDVLHMMFSTFITKLTITTLEIFTDWLQHAWWLRYSSFHEE